MASCIRCEPSAACTSSIHDWALRNGQGFWVGQMGRAGLGLKLLTLQLGHLLECAPPPPARVELFDIGAGIHNLAPHIAYSTSRLHPDDSDALWLLSRFEGRADVHAWEVNTAAAKQLRRAAEPRFIRVGEVPHENSAAPT